MRAASPTGRLYLVWNVVMVCSYFERCGAGDREQVNLAIMHQIYGFGSVDEASKFQEKITYIQGLQSSVWESF